LLIGFVQVAALLLVLPAKAAAHPDIRPSLAAGRLADSALERVPGAVGIGGGRGRLPQQGTEIEKMLLAGAAFGEVGALPLGSEFVRRHPCGPSGVGSFVPRAVRVFRHAGVMGLQASGPTTSSVCSRLGCCEIGSIPTPRLATPRF